MPWEIKGDVIRFSGTLQQWTRAFEKWYQEDASALGNQIDFAAYCGRMAVLCAEKAKEKWSGQLFSGRAKANKLEEFFTRGQGGNVSVETFDLLDYIAENIGVPDLLTWGPNLRQMVKAWK